jgi:2'-5' RNA ligase
MRTFIAVDINDRLKKNIFDVAQGFKKYCKGSYVKPDLYHITLFFFGDIPEDKTIIIRNILRGINYPLFSIKLTGVDCFFTNKKPRVCFVKGESPSLMELFTIIEKKLIENNVLPDRKPLKIHSTFLRIKHIFDNEGIVKYIETINKNFSVVSFVVNELILYNSKLSKNGPEYYKYFIKNLNEVDK